MKINSTILVIGIVILAFLSLVISRQLKQPQNKVTNKIGVVTSFYPLYFFTSEIAKDHANVVNLTPAGAEPHDYEPNTQDITSIEMSKLLIINGSGFEPWADKLHEELQNKQVRIVAVSEGEKNKDPHTWLDPVFAKQEVGNITQALTDIDPENKSVYEANRQKLEGQLDDLNKAFRDGLKSCKQKNIVTSHAAFGYVASRYGLKQVSISGLTPDEEPSPQKLAEISAFAKANAVKYVFFETLVSPRLAETIAKEVGAKTLVFDPLEGLTKEDEAAGRNYFTIQAENLKNLKIALECI